MIPRGAHLILIGAMKCGTSTLFGHLTRHPEIVGSRTKEPEFFSEHQGHGLDVERYEDLWDFDPAEHRFCVEASTGYTKYPDEPHVPDRMREAGVDPKFIYVVRDPLDRIESHFNHGRMRRSSWAYESFLDPGLVNPSRYYMQLQQFLLRFPERDRYRIVDFDELIERPADVMDGVFRWLGLDPVPVPAALHENRSPEPSRLELLFGGVDLSAPFALLPRSIKDGLRTVIRTHAPGKRRMSGKERERAAAYLARDIGLFGETFDFPVEKWGF